MSFKKLGIASSLTLLAALVAPGIAAAEPVQLEAFTAKALELDMVWVAFATVLVFFMQAGFMFLEIGFSRMKNAGAGVAKILVNLGIVTLAWWAVGYGIAGFGEGSLADFIGTDGFFFHFDQDILGTAVTADTAMLMLFGLAFCAVSLAIVWGTTLERIKFSSYVIYAVVFGAIIYPMVAHSVWGGGLLSDVGGKPVMDFAGSSVVHLTGATGGLAALLLLGARKGKYAADGSPRAIPGHSMPLGGLGVMILWIGWFGFNAGSTLSVDVGGVGFFAYVALNTNLGAAARPARRVRPVAADPVLARGPGLALLARRDRRAAPRAGQRARRGLSPGRRAPPDPEPTTRSRGGCLPRGSACLS